MIVALVDGNLTDNQKSHADGNYITAKIHQDHPNVVVIGAPSEGEIEGASENVQKIQSSDVLLSLLAKIFTS